MHTGWNLGFHLRFVVQQKNHKPNPVGWAGTVTAARFGASEMPEGLAQHLI